MRNTIVSRVGLIFGVFLLIAASGTSAVLAHERRDVDKYQLVVGFILEPAFEGVKNGLDLRVSIPGAAEGESAPVEGLEETLQVEITHVPSGELKPLILRTIFNDPGHYTSDLIPTAPGVYQFRIFGTIEGTQIDETFISRGGGGGFGDIESSEELQFPQKLPEIREVEGAVRGAQQTAAQASSEASSAATLGIIGIVLGTVGMATGIGGLVVGMRGR